jgi:ABC-type transport system involved in cytochrome c biogenesis permease subunit
MSRIATITGIILLGIGLALGHFVAIYILEDYNLWDPKIVIMDAAWAAYFVGFLVVKLRGLSGIRMGYLSLAAYLGLLLMMILSNMLTSSFHSFQP